MRDRSLISNLFTAGVLVAAFGCGGGAGTVPSGAGGASARTPSIAFIVDGKAVADGAHVLWGERTAVRVSGLTPEQSVTLTVDEKQIDSLFRSRSTFTAGADGVVDTSALAPLHAAYTGVDVDGPIWSAASISADASLPTNGVSVDVEDKSGASLTHAAIVRDFVSPTTTHTAVHDNGLVGVFYAPNDRQRHPAILAFGGSEGGLSGGENYAAYYSARGYAVLGLAYFGAPGLPQTLSRIPLEYFQTAIQWLKARPEVDPARLAVMGASRGGELALLLGATFPSVKAVVAFAPSGVLWPQVGGGQIAAWTLAGKDLPFVPAPFNAQPTFSTDQDGTTLVAEAPMFLKALQEASAAEIDAATIRVEKTQGPILMLGGADDQLWQACQLAKIAMDRLNASGHAAQYGDQLVCYPSAGHVIYFPGESTLEAYRVPFPSSSSFGNDDLLLGGTPAGIAHASRHADDQVEKFLAHAFQ